MEENFLKEDPTTYEIEPSQKRKELFKVEIEKFTLDKNNKLKLLEAQAKSKPCKQSPIDQYKNLLKIKDEIIKNRIQKNIIQKIQAIMLKMQSLNGITSKKLFFNLKLILVMYLLGHLQFLWDQILL